ncbi:hypothetical protein [Ancylobacter pratisalsi]|uniref:Uncharacterized protein n=1 Tax=Ancylobacter pratisalsi TaxID=1745854 RepID=A0A6P1YK90_9HYPH|nr:hypothetical protein [Ancylobacter pratisalsi]QIB33535.1 hypothetical protein G3A50_07315 [Ancylobacter pratisalsi]
MTATPTLPASKPRAISRDAQTHIFVVGQTVRLKGGYGVSASRFGDIYRITGTLPPRENSLQYRIRNESEQYERVTTEDCLELVAAAAPGETGTLRERTFRNA